MALVGASVVSSKSKLNTLGMACIGLILGTIGTDLHTGVSRFTFGQIHFDEGLDFIPVSAALFAFTEIAFRLGSSEEVRQVKTKLRDVMPRWADIRQAALPTIRGTALGSALGVLPGTGPFIASYSAYALETKLAKDPSRFGKGAIEGVAAPEAANNASAFTHFIPMLTLGIPAGAVFAMLMGALQQQGIQPGPDIMTSHPDLFWGLIASMWLGNLMLLVLNLPLIGVWVKLLETPYRFIYPTILLLSCIGCYAVNNQAIDLRVAAFALLASYVLEKLDCAPGPVIIAMILGPILEENARFCGEVLAPLNWSGDVEHSVRNADGSVSTPKGFKEAFRQFGEGEAELLGEHLDLFAGLRLLPGFEGGNRLGNGLLQIAQLSEGHSRQVEIRHRVLRLIQCVWRIRAQPLGQDRQQDRARADAQVQHLGHGLAVVHGPGQHFEAQALGLAHFGGIEFTPER